MCQAEESFGNFGFARALEFLGLFPYTKWEMDITPLAVSEVLKINLQRAERQVTTGSNEWERFCLYTLSSSVQTSLCHSV